MKKCDKCDIFYVNNKRDTRITILNVTPYDIHMLIHDIFRMR